MLRTYTLQLRPTQEQRHRLAAILAVSCELYNAALQERREAWERQRKSIQYYDQQLQITQLNAECPSVLDGIAVDILREPLRRLDRSFKAFFRRVRAGQHPGYPRFRSRSRYDSFTFGTHPVNAKNNLLSIPGLGRVRFRTKQFLPASIKTATIKRQGKKWVARLVCDIGPAPEKIAVATATGIDVGLTHFLTLSDGAQVENPRWLKQHEDRIAVAHRVLARKKRGSKNRERARLALSRTYERLRDSRRNFTHHVSNWPAP